MREMRPRLLRRDERPGQESPIHEVVDGAQKAPGEKTKEGWSGKSAAAAARIPLAHIFEPDRRPALGDPPRDVAPRISMKC